MRENVLYQPRVEEKSPVITPQQESANDSVYSKEQENSSQVTETIIADDKFTESRLTKEDFREEIIMARKLTGSAQNLEKEVIIADEAFAKPVAFEDASKHRLTRADFTKEAIEHARELKGITPRLQLGSEYPEHVKIERALRVNETDEEKKTEEVFPPVEPRDTSPLETKRLSRSDFPGTGSAEMPPLVFKKEETLPERKNFFKRFLPNFVSRYFSR